MCLALAFGYCVGIPSLESTVEQLEIEVNDALEIFEKADLSHRTIDLPCLCARSVRTRPAAVWRGAQLALPGPEADSRHFASMRSL